MRNLFFCGKEALIQRRKRNVSTHNDLIKNIPRAVDRQGVDPAAIAFVLMLFEIPLPFAPSFYKLGFDEVAVMLGGFALGPLAGAAIETLKVVLNVLFQGSDTAFVGELSNLLIGLSLVVPSALFYQRHKTLKGAMIALVIGVVSMALIGCLANYFIALPAYSYFYGAADERDHRHGKCNPAAGCRTS